MQRDRIRLASWLAVLLLLVPLVGCYTLGTDRPDGSGQPADGQSLDSANANAATSANELSSEPRPEKLEVSSFADLLALKDSAGHPRPDWIDVGFGNLLVAYEAGYATQEEVNQARRQIEELVEQAKRKIDTTPDRLLNPAGIRQRDRRNAQKIVQTIVEAGFAFDSADPKGYNIDNLFLHRVLSRRRGYCVSLSLLVLSVAYYLDVPLHGVRAPAHMFVRFGDYDDVDGDALNFEMTAHGASRDDAYYIHRFAIDPAAIINGTFMRNLDNKQVLSEVCNNLGSLLYLDEKFDAAAKWYETALQCDVKNSQAHFNLAMAHVKLADPQSAIGHFREAIRLNPADYHAWCGRGRLYIELGDPDVGFADLAQAIALQPTNPHAHVLSGMLHANLGDYKAAETDFKNAIAHEPNHLNANRNLGILFLKQEKFSDAEPYLKKFISLAPADDPDAADFREFLDSRRND